jgi:hypothetical protein
MDRLSHLDREIQRLQSEALGLGDGVRFLGGMYFDGLSVGEKTLLTPKDYELEHCLISAEQTVRPLIEQHNKAKQGSDFYSMTRIDAKIFTRIMKILYTTALQTEYAYTEQTGTISGHAFGIVVDQMKLLANELEHILNQDASSNDKKCANAVKGLARVKWDHALYNIEDGDYDLENETRHRVPAEERGQYAVSGSRSRRRQSGRANDPL